MGCVSKAAYNDAFTIGEKMGIAEGRLSCDNYKLIDLYLSDQITREEYLDLKHRMIK